MAQPDLILITQHNNIKINQNCELLTATLNLSCNSSPESPQSQILPLLTPPNDPNLRDLKSNSHAQKLQ